MKIQAIQCKSCFDIIFSCSRHDFRTCSCGKTSIDGGFDYVKVCFDDKVGFDKLSIKVDATKKELYDDWNLQSKFKVRKFGLIKTCLICRKSLDGKLKLSKFNNNIHAKCQPVPA